MDRTHDNRGRHTGAALAAIAAVGMATAAVVGTPAGASIGHSGSPPATTGLRQEAKTILFLGDSLTAGYGLPVEESFPNLIARRLEHQGSPFEVLNAGIPGDTSAGGSRRIDWLLRRRIDVLVLELGANDMLRGLPLGLTRDNLQAIIDKTRAKYPEVKIVVAGMLAPPNLGPEYTAEFRNLFPELARANDAALIPFLLEGVAARPELNLADGIHPNAEGHRIVAEQVWAILEPLLE